MAGFTSIGRAAVRRGSRRPPGVPHGYGPEGFATRSARWYERARQRINRTEFGLEQALEELRRARFDPGALPHLVLLDLRIPRVDGLEVLRRIRADTALQPLPVVVLTSSERDDDREGALRLGATWYVCKPVEGARFRAEVQQLGDRWAAALA
ncbi:MAG TPA: response regulator [Actinomycetes bacterium]|nr:response regulator [Actinomycetes bacterium]